MPATKLTPTVSAQIVTLLRHGNYRETAAAAAGVDVVTIREWMKQGAKGIKPYAAFCAEMNQAEAEAESNGIRSIDMAGKDDWRALAWRIERRAASRWAYKVKVEVQQAHDAMLDRLQLALESEPELFERIVRLVIGGEDTAAPERIEFKEVEDRANRPDDGRDGSILKALPASVDPVSEATEVSGT